MGFHAAEDGARGVPRSAGRIHDNLIPQVRRAVGIEAELLEEVGDIPSKASAVGYIIRARLLSSCSGYADPLEPRVPDVKRFQPAAKPPPDHLRHFRYMRRVKNLLQHLAHLLFGEFALVVEFPSDERGRRPEIGIGFPLRPEQSSSSSYRRPPPPRWKRGDPPAPAPPHRMRMPRGLRSYPGSSPGGISDDGFRNRLPHNVFHDGIDHALSAKPFFGREIRILGLDFVRRCQWDKSCCPGGKRRSPRSVTRWCV